MNQSHLFNFTRTQREIADLIAIGHTPSSLAEHLVVSKAAITRQLSLMYMAARAHGFDNLKAALLRDRQPEVSA